MKVEGSDIAFVDMQSGEPSLGASLAQHGAGVGIPFNGADGGMADDEIGKQSTAAASEEVHGSHGLPIPLAEDRPDLFNMRLQHAQCSRVVFLEVLGQCLERVQRDGQPGELRIDAAESLAEFGVGVG